MANRIRTGDPHGFNSSSKFCIGFWVQQIPEEGQRTYQPKHCGNNNKDKDNSQKTPHDKNHQVSSQKFWQQIECLWIEPSFIKFFVAEKSKPYEIYRRMCDVYGEACFHQKMFTNWLNMGLLFWAWVKKIAHGVETNWLSCKESSGHSRVHVDSLLGHERMNHDWFLLKKCHYKVLSIVNSLGKVQHIHWTILILINMFFCLLI